MRGSDQPAGVRSANFSVEVRIACSIQLRITPRADTVICGCEVMPVAGSVSGSSVTDQACSGAGPAGAAVSAGASLRRHAGTARVAATTAAAIRYRIRPPSAENSIGQCIRRVRIGDFEVTTFGVMVAIGALVGLWVFQRELARRGLPENGVDAAIAGVLGGLAGAKLLWTIEFSGQGEPLANLLFSRGGLSWFGGLLGGVAVGSWMLRRRRIPWIAGLAAAAPALAIGHAIGRIGCFSSATTMDARPISLGCRLSRGTAADDGPRPSDTAL